MLLLFAISGLILDIEYSSKFIMDNKNKFIF